MAKKSQRFISFILFLTIIMSFIPAEALAVKENDTNVDADIIAMDNALKEELTADDVVGEVESFRTDDTKHFKLQDGSYIAVQYETNVHYKDKTGKWQDINNELVSNTSELDTTDNELVPNASESDITDNELVPNASESDITDNELVPNASESDITENEFVPNTSESDITDNELVSNTSESDATENEFVPNASESDITDDGSKSDTIDNYTIDRDNLNISFSANSEEETDLEVENDKYSVSFNMNKVESTEAKVEGKNKKDDTSLASAFELPNISSTITYAGIQNGIDLQYTMYGNDIKETIVINEKQDDYTYSFDLNLDNLKPVSNEDGSISLEDNVTGEQKYLIPAPYMFDAVGSYSTDVYYKLEQKTKGEYVLFVCANSDWINNSSREFPINVDPTLVQSTDSSNTEITYVTSGAPNTNHAGWNALFLGYDSAGTDKNRILLRVNQLPVLPDNSVVVNASVYFAQYDYSYVTQNTMNVEARPITSNLASINNSTWNTQPTYSDEIVDYNAISSSTNYNYVAWDLTRLTKNWYINPSTNYGAVLMATNEATMSDVNCAKAYFNSLYSSTNQPKYVVQYRNTVGLEDYYTYNAQDIGRAGTGYISDYTAQMTLVKEDASNLGAINFTLSHVYNSTYSGGNFATQATHTANYSGMLMGSGWKLNAQQSVVETTLQDVNGNSKTYLLYTDGDGTEHYFSYNSDGYYYDEDGLNLKIQKVVDSGLTKYIMTDKKANIMEFYNGLLSVMSDSNGNKIRFIYNDYYADVSGTGWYPTGNGDKLYAIRQYNNGESSYTTIADLAYDASGYLTKVADRAGNQTSYTYTTNGSNKNLTTITHADLTTANYQYNGINNKMSLATDSEAHYSINYGYDSVSKKINIFREYGTSSLGNYVGVNGNTYGITKYRTAGNDRNFYTKDDIISYYVFDDFGHTINAYSTDNDGNTILGATTNAYSPTSDTSKLNNRLSHTASIGTSSENLLNYGGMETNDWWPSGSGDLASLSRSADKPRTGNYSLKVALSSGYSGTAEFVLSKSVKLTAGQTYTFSAYVNTNKAENMTGGVYLKADDGSTTFEGDVFGEITSSTVAGGWRRISLTFEANSSANHTFSICYSGFTKEIYADDAQLEVGSASGNCNLADHGGFEDSYGWLNNADKYVNYTDEESLTGENSLKIEGNPNNEYYAYQEIPINLSSNNQTFVLSGWAKAVSVPTTPSGIRAFGLKAQVVYSDETVEDHLAPFCSDTTQWQFASVAIVPKQENKMVSYIRIYCLYLNNANKAYFENISLVRELAQTYKYDSDGNLVNVASTDNNEDVTYTYSGADLMTMATGSNGEYIYTYDNSHNVKTVANNGVTMTLSYDSKGNTTASTLSGTSGSTINSSATYTDNGNLVATISDSRNNTTDYTYGGNINKITGNPSSVKNAKGVTTNYRYNTTNGRESLSYISGKISVEPAYENGSLASLTRGGYITEGGVKQLQSYNFGYDGYGNRTSVMVGPTSSGRTLADYDYATGNGLLTGITYGNGASTSYTYDKLERISSVLYNNGKKYDYTYTGNGQLYSAKASDGSESEIFDYDGIGRLIYGENTNTEMTQNIRYSYDQSNRLKGFGYIIDFENGSTKIDQYETYNYNTDGTLASKRTGSGDTLEYGYDQLKRPVSKTINPNLSQVFAYTNGSAEYTTTTLINGMLYKDAAGTRLKKFGYYYDALGNITEVFNDTATEASYTYDNQNQVISETLPELDLVYTYNYDTYGNIRSVTSQPISGGVATTKTYTYGDSTWLDLLTEYDGNTITYDEIGNPINYYDGTNFTWQNGRQLASLTKEGVTASYVYNEDGIRTQKTVDGVVHDYILDGTRILADYSSGSELIFAYDENNTPQSFTYNRTKYNYITNLQGDVIEIRDSSNNIVGSYVYNAYGEIISKSGAMADINPLRYRGYYYDTETGFYYLNSRYYDPGIGRFINVDSLINSNDFQGYNLFAYCGNNPVMNSDHTGHLKIHNLVKFAVGAVVIVGLTVATVVTGGLAAVVCGAALTGAIVSGTTGAVVGGLVAKQTGGNVVDAVANGFMWGAITGAASGAVGASSLGIGMQIAVNTTLSTTAYVAQSKFDGGKVTVPGLIISAGGGALSGAIGSSGMTSKGTGFADALALNAKTIAREVRRANTVYSSKSIIRSAEYVSKVGWKTLPSSFSRLAAGGMIGTTVGGVIPLFSN